MSDAPEALRRIAESVADALRDFASALSGASSNAALLVAELQRARAAAEAADDPELVAALSPMFGAEAGDIARHIALPTPVRYRYPLLRRAIRYALADGMMQSVTVHR